MPKDMPGHIVIINRWRERFAEYESYFDHRRDAISYITTPEAAGRIPAGVDASIVAATDDTVQVRAAVTELAARHGAPTGVVALQENDLLVAAGLREAYGLAGPTTAQLLPFRDKALMYARTQESGVPQPPYATVTGPSEVSAFAERHGWPVVLKPRDGCASAGVMIATGPGDLGNMSRQFDKMLVQAYEDAPVYHFDGFFDGTRAHGRLSRYINTCYDFRFRAGTPLGSVEEDSADLQDAATRTAVATLSALTTEPTVFHLELFGHAAGGRLSFSLLEVAARMAAAEVPLIWREVHGFDLMRIAAELQLGRTLEVPEIVASPPWAGWLLAPTPVPRPCRITRAHSFVGDLPTIYAEVGPRVGDVVPAASSFYEHVAGRFRFRGDSTAAIEKDILAVAQRYRVEGVPLH